MTKATWVFPGQGSQAIGMGMDLLTLPAAKAMFDQATEILGWSPINIIQADEVKLSQTRYTQPCMYVVESVLADQLKAKGQSPDFVAGHSLGEYAALYTAGVFDFATGLRLIQRRAQLMDGATDGTMAALLGFDREQLESALGQVPDAVLANDNNAGQVVISGTPAAVDDVIGQVKCKKAVKLKVSGAFHSPLMADAADEFQQVLADVKFVDAVVPVMSNVAPTPSQDATVLQQRLAQQMTGSVRWRELTLNLAAQAVSRVVEVGPGKVLIGIMKRTDKTLTYDTVGTLADLEA
ncbi:ACP S-malonyltransferase [filamentous cyanobacterium LEGE 11480]|uniref:Malonyl CoA-acyl carrier protein transacylase n=1 Tax=Romeriopsis navalis LEGE 11480 TaxID=2777977 RepID=A0A928VIF5_9CYAN|nr:ACP S-malonyltransferase [Romeriopsis navalis]MBE9028272.1 ACP S-malonyltransferase [Romeriopsis navalis LEGE 11480]